MKEQVKQYLDSIGAYYFMPVQTGYGQSTLDFLVCYRGRFYAIETKAPGKKPTARQHVVARKIDLAGGTVMIVDTIEQVKERLRYQF